MAGKVWHPSVSVKAFAEKPHLWLGGLSRNGIPEFPARKPRYRGGTSPQLGTEGPPVPAYLHSGSFDPELWASPLGRGSGLLGLSSLTGVAPSVFEASKHELSCTADSYGPDCSCLQDA